MALSVVGHRGMGPTSILKQIPEAMAPENTICAFSQALDLGADGIEFDVALSKDNQIVVIHDDELNRNVAGASRSDINLGFVSDFTVDELKGFDVGHGEKIPTLTEVLDLIVSRNIDYKNKNGKSLIVNIELKGENVVDRTYETIMEYVEKGLIPKDSFLFNTFKWERLKEMRLKDPDLRLVPNIKTVDLFELQNVQMPGFCVEDVCQYKPSALQKLQELHDDISCYALDCVVYDLRQPLLDLCIKNNIGMYASTSNERTATAGLSKAFELLHANSGKIPTIFKADHAARAIAYKEMLENKQDATHLIAAQFLSNQPPLPNPVKPAKKP